MFGDHTIGDAILDRVIHRAHRLELKGPSMRKRHNSEVNAAVSTGLTNAKEK
jgi:DNA replication protein DnaC